MVIVEGQSKSGLMVAINLQSHFPKKDYYYETEFNRHDCIGRIRVLLLQFLNTKSVSQLVEQCPYIPNYKLHFGLANKLLL